MPSPARHVEVFGRSFERSRTLAAVLFAAALAFMVTGTAVGGPVGTILAAIGATLGTTSLVSFLYDPFLKDILAQEIFERVGLRDSIVRAGLLDIGGIDVALAARLAGSRRVVVAPVDPLSWAREHFGEIVGVVEAAPAEVLILLPSPDRRPGRALLADRLDLVETELERKLKALPEDLLKAWDHGSPAEGSTLRLLWHEELLSSGLLVCDACAVLETGPALRQSATDRTVLTQIFEPHSPYGRWMADQLEELVQAGIPAGLRPVTPAAELPGRHATAAEAVETTGRADVPPSVADASAASAGGQSTAGGTSEPHEREGDDVA